MRTEENMDIKVWLADIERESGELTMKVAENYGEYGKKVVEKLLSSARRQGRVPEKRGVHMYEDVKLRKSRAKGYMTLGGGRMTGTLWHIVNDGTYQTTGIHFIEKALDQMDKYEGGWDDKES